MDGSGNGIEWYECSVRWQREDKRALAAWVTRADGSGVGILVYTKPMQVIRKTEGPTDVRNAYDLLYQYTVSGYSSSFASSISDAMREAVALALISDPLQSISRFKTRQLWMNELTLLSQATT